MKTILYQLNAMTKDYYICIYFDDYDKANDYAKSHSYKDFYIDKQEFTHTKPLNYFDGCTFIDLNKPKMSKNKYLIVCKNDYDEFSYIRYSDTPEHCAEKLADQYKWYCDFNQWYDDSKNDYCTGVFEKRDYRGIFKAKCKFEVFLQN